MRIHRIAKYLALAFVAELLACGGTVVPSEDRSQSAGSTSSGTTERGTGGGPTAPAADPEGSGGNRNGDATGRGGFAGSLSTGVADAAGAAGKKANAGGASGASDATGGGGMSEQPITDAGERPEPDGSPTDAYLPPNGCQIHPALIDDMEDGTGHICQGEGRIGRWYAFNDGTGEQWPPPASDLSTAIPSSPIPGGRGESTRAMHTYGRGFGRSGTNWGVGIGLDLHFDGKQFQPYDAGSFTGVTFWAQSPLAHKLEFRVSTTATTITKYGGTCTCPTPDCEEESARCNVAGAKAIALTTEWTQYWVPFTEIYQYSTNISFDQHTITNIQFYYPYGEEFDYWVDDISFYTNAP